MDATFGLIGTGEMGTGIGRWLVAHGARVATTLAGRSAASGERVRSGGITVLDDLAAVAHTCPVVMSIVPPDQAVAVAEAFVAAHAGSLAHSVFVDCNAIAPVTAQRIEAIVTAGGIAFVDAGIIGGAPRTGYDGPRVYACGDEVAAFAQLTAFGLQVRTLEGPAGTASALKLCYAGISKGLTAIGTAMFSAAEHHGLRDALTAEFAESQPQLHTWLTRQIAAMYPKAYRWVGEMREIALFGADEPGVPVAYEGFAQFYAAVAQDQQTRA